MRPRFFLPDLDVVAGTGVLLEDEASHLTRVLRLGEGAEVDVFDGRGGLFRARVAALSRGRVTVQVIAPEVAAAEPGVRVTLVMSVLKGDKMDAVVRDATMMGISALQPIVSARSETTIAVLERGHRVARWTRIAVSSVKQCGRALVPVIQSPMTVDQWLATPGDATRLALVEPSAGHGRAPSDIPVARAVALLVGPEGGWSPEESASMTTSGVIAVSLGPRTLRADVVPTVALAALFEAWRTW